ncbi:MAG TPA: T9SS type A sorting domain-containing protein, partial [Chitinophagaceae bacterium]|nr:T9SS type A sorting domain-containing protein [Chitinophagaceae bacterium]
SYPQVSNTPVNITSNLQLYTNWHTSDSSTITLQFTNGSQTIRNVSFTIGDVDKASVTSPSYVDYVTVTGLNGAVTVQPDNLTLVDTTAGYTLVNGNEALGDPTNGNGGNCPNVITADPSPTPSDASVNVHFTNDINEIIIKFKDPPAFQSPTQVATQVITLGAITFSTGLNPLPVQLGDFTGKLNGDNVNLNWNTLSELNNDHFDVQRSLDGQYFTTIGTVKGSGTTNIPQQYSYTDNILKISAPVLYYRLNQVNFDGTSAFSKIVEVKVNSSNIRVTNIYPNPFMDQVQLQMQFNNSGTALINLYSPAGTQVYSTQQTVISGDNTFTLGNLANLPRGMYIIEVKLGNSVYRDKLLKQ